MQIPTIEEISTAAHAVNRAPEQEGAEILRRAWASHKLFNEAERIAAWMDSQQGTSSPGADRTTAILSAMALGMNVGMRIVEGRRKPESTSPSGIHTDAVEDQPITEKARCA